jgi:hypothetical protein
MTMDLESIYERVLILIFAIQIFGHLLGVLQNGLLYRGSFGSGLLYKKSI